MLRYQDVAFRIAYIALGDSAEADDAAQEAFIKALGDGLFHPLDRFDVSLTPGEPAQILRVADVPGDRCRWRLEGFSPVPGFVAAVVTERLIEEMADLVLGRDPSSRLHPLRASAVEAGDRTSDLAAEFFDSAV